MAHDMQQIAATALIVMMWRDGGEESALGYRTRKVGGHVRIYRDGVWVASVI